MACATKVTTLGMVIGPRRQSTGKYDLTTIRLTPAEGSFLPGAPAERVYIRGVWPSNSTSDSNSSEDSPHTDLWLAAERPKSS